MCEPTTLAIMAMASTAASTAGQMSQARATQKALGQQREAQAEEINAQVSQKAGDRVEAARAERARLRVAAGEAGVSGNSFEAQIMDTVMQQEEDIGRVMMGGEFQQRASEVNYKSAMAQNRGPSPLAAGLNIASSGASGYATGLQIKTMREGGS
jgi:hypothetical protein